MLEVKGITKRFGGLVAVNNVDLTLEGGEILGLVGPNGAGKTTLLNLISGVHKPDRGGIYLEKEDITRLPLDAVCRKGVAKTFQQPQSFPGLTVREGIMVSAIFGNGRRPGMAEVHAEAEKCLNYVGIPAEKMDAPLSSLNTMELRRAQLARALASHPKILLLDELMTGLNPTEGTDAIKLIKRIRDDGITILMIEHVMRVIMGVSDRIVVLDRGEKIAEGSPAEIASDPRVIDSYLGERYAF
ncbi:MAG: ABC transporter ATP-binding protein [Methanomicrobiales archaeon]|nr:ABC transporter ATP-binding protein [Methanomicrobiales archaeon]